MEISGIIQRGIGLGLEPGGSSEEEKVNADILKLRLQIKLCRNGNTERDVWRIQNKWVPKMRLGERWIKRCVHF